LNDGVVAACLAGAGGAGTTAATALTVAITELLRPGNDIAIAAARRGSGDDGTAGDEADDVVVVDAAWSAKAMSLLVA
jgi:hypothetical protein